MKVLTLISRQERIRYGIVKEKTCLTISRPFNLMIEYDPGFKVLRDAFGFVISNNKCAVKFYDDPVRVYITIF